MPNIPNLIHIFSAHEAKQRKTARAFTHAPHMLMVAFVAFSVLIMAYSSLFKIWPILLFFALWLPLPWWRGGFDTFAPTRTLLFTLALPLLCTASTLWSQHPITTLYLGCAFIALNLCVWISARMADFSAWVAGIAIGATLTLGLTLASNHYIANPATGQPELFGLFSSKNQVGFTAEIGILAATALLFVPGSRSRRYVNATITLIISAACLYLSHSITALLSLVAVAGSILLVMALRLIPSRTRLMALLCLGIIAIAAAIAFFAMGGADLLLHAMGKDASLTGRTYLWAEGIKLAQEHPFIGRGYSAFWVQGEPLAERYWQEFFITARSGFHFHQTFIQAMVDLGIIGAVLIAWLLLWNFGVALRSALTRDRAAESLFLLALALMFLFRAGFEIDILTGPFGNGAFLFYAILPRLARKT